MKKMIAIAAFLATGATATSVLALPSPYQGSDTLFDLTTQAIAAANLTPTGAYVGGGSGNGASAMAQPVLASAKQAHGADVAHDEERVEHLHHVQRRDREREHGGERLCDRDRARRGRCPLLHHRRQRRGVQRHGGQHGHRPRVQRDVRGLRERKRGSDLEVGSRARLRGSRSLEPTATADCNSAPRKALVANWSQFFQNGCAGNAARAAPAPLRTAACGTPSGATTRRARPTSSPPFSASPRAPRTRR